MELSEYRDDNGNSLPPSFIETVLIPSQFASAAEAEGVETSGESTQFVLLVNLVLNVVTAKSADQLWSIVNNLQVVLMMRLFDV